MDQKDETHQAIMLAGRQCPSSKPSGSVGGALRLVKAKPCGRPSAGLDNPPNTACLFHAVRNGARPMNPIDAAIKNGLTNESS
jgi:hypothetical protein